jgi:Tfp pilus assembly protein PilF
MAETEKNDGAPAAAVEIFISYSHLNRSLLPELCNALSALRREGALLHWDDRQIDPGEKWGDKIDQQLNSADVILLLISAGFIASDYCYAIEMQRAMQRLEAHEAEVVPIIVEDCDWSNLKFAKLQVLPDGATAVTLWDNRAAAWTSVAKGIRKVVEKVSAKRQAAAVTPPAEKAASEVKIPTSGKIGQKWGTRQTVWNVPHNRNKNFTGRETILVGLHEALASGGRAALTQALTGLGGVGKTQTAVEYAYRYRGDYDLVWWIQAEEPAKLASDFAGLAKPLGLKEEQDLSATVAAVKAELGQRGRWLLVFDNANKVEEVRGYLPQTEHGHILITSRDPNWAEVAEPLRITTWPRKDSVEFLLKRTKQEDEAAANGLAEALGDLPLALEQASAYIGASGISLAEYLRILRERTREILRSGQAPAGYHATVATTWKLAFAEVEKASEAAAQLMNLVAFLAPDDIGREMLRSGAKHLPEPLAAEVQDDLKWNDAVGALRKYSLAEVRDGVLAVHRLVQAVVRERLDEAGQKKWAEAAVKVVNAAFPYDLNSVQTWTPSGRMLRHALLAAEDAGRLRIGLESAGRLLNHVGLYLRGRADLAGARSALERALRMGETAYGVDHPEVAIRVNNLGLVLHDQGDLSGARKCHERALRIDEAAYGPEHPQVAINVNNLGRVLQDQGDLSGARASFERALKIDEVAYGSNHPHVAVRVNNLGGVLWQQNDFPAAQANFERALKIDEAAYGPDHPNVARDVNNLGLALQDQGDLKGARNCYERALKIDEAAYGPDHPQVALRVSNLGGVMQQQGNLAAARRYFERALKIFEGSLGRDHPRTQIARSGLESLGPG